MAEPQRVATRLVSSVVLLSAVLLSAVLLSAGCVATNENLSWLSGEQTRRYVGASSLRLRWNERVTPTYEGAFQPVEGSTPALDPGRDRIYLGTSAGDFYAMTSGGRTLYRYEAGGAVSSTAALDTEADEVFVATEQGEVHKLEASSGDRIWRDQVGGPIRNAPRLTDDTIYIVTDSDEVVAIARDTGDILWSYDRPPIEGFAIAGHAGLLLTDDLLFTGFSDGTVVALDPRDGDVIWERDTSVDVDAEAGGRPRFVDVDTTPVRIGDELYAASFSAGLYRMEAQSGSVLERDETLTGVTAISEFDGRVFFSSSDLGLVCRSAMDHRELWRHALQRGAPSRVVVSGRQVLFGESTGSFISLDLRTGNELTRFDAGRGFSAPAAVARGLGFVLSNGGSLFAFTL